MRPCKACGVDLIFAINSQTNKIIPLHKVTAYEVEYEQLQDNQGNNSDKAEAIKVERPIYVSHFLTCSKPNDFSKNNTRESK